MTIDHIVGNVEVGKMDQWGAFYEKVFGFPTFVRFDETDISTKYSALKSVVLRSKNWKIKLVDTISDNASSAGLILGGQKEDLTWLIK